MQMLLLALLPEQTQLIMLMESDAEAAAAYVGAADVAAAVDASAGGGAGRGDQNPSCACSFDVCPPESKPVPADLLLPSSWVAPVVAEVVLLKHQKTLKKLREKKAP